MKELTYEIEEKYFSPYAMKSIDTKEIAPCPLRTDYQRDRDRIIHSKAFRRLKHKTQVFLSPEGDHYRTRLTHTLEVTQIARTVARALRLNEDLTEAIALGHDLGHTPFGHTGERTLKRLSGHFEHNEQSLRVVDMLENGGQGLNLTFEVRDGIVNHKMRCTPATLEGKVVSYSDRIAYINHDIEDAVRAEMLTEDMLPREARALLGDSKGKRINNLINDLIKNSTGKSIIAFSSKYASAFKEFLDFMDRNVYDAGSKAKSEEIKANKLIELLYGEFISRPEIMPEFYRGMIEKYGIKTVVCDYIASMTDRYALKVFEEIFIPVNWNVL
jgi:dGTPase